METHRLQILLDIAVQGSCLDGDNLRGRIRVMGDGRATLRAEQTVDIVAGRALAGVFLDGTVNGQLGLGDNSHQSFSISYHASIKQEGRNITYSRSNHSVAGSHRSGRRP